MEPKFNIYDRVKYKYAKIYGRIHSQRYVVHEPEIYKSDGYYYDVMYPDGKILEELPEDDLELIEEDSLAKPVYLTSAHKIGQAIWIKDALKECGIGGNKMNNSDIRPFKVGNYIETRTIPSKKGFISHVVSIDGGPDTWYYDVELYDPEIGKHITHRHVKHTNLSHITETEYRFYKEHSANFATKESADSYYIPKRIIYNDPATIVFWSDGTKTVVKKAEGEAFNSYTAFCAALAKKMFGNNSIVNKIVKSGYYQKDKNAK